MRISKKFSSPIIVALLVFILGASATYLSWSSSRERTKQKTENELAAQTETFITSMQTRTTAIEEILRGTISLASNESFNDSKFSEYIDSLNIDDRYPSVESLGYISIVKHEGLDDFLEQMKLDSKPNFLIYPTGKRDTYSPIIYIKSIYSTAQTSSIIGYDISTDKNLNPILEAAKASGKPTLSKLITLSDMNTDSFQPGVALIAPIYSSTVHIPENVSGFIYSTIRVRTYVQIGLDATKQKISIALYDGKTDDESKLLFGIHNRSRDNAKITNFNIAGRTWTVVVTDTSGQLSNDQNQSGLLLVLGIILSGLVASFLLYIIRTKSRAVELQKQLEIESAKDDLLSLASHQLRTPATSVKQYLGMVLEGYAGDISNEQNNMLNKAYESNERQLAIVNQILNLSKLESRSPVLKKKPVDIVALSNDVVLDETLLLAGKKVKVTPKGKKIYADVDKSYLRMVIENLLTNASKYSFEDAEISIDVAESQSDTYIRVKDTGIGIDQKDFDDLFVLFNRVDNELSLNVSGTGIGLYVCKLVIGLHGGKIDVESVVGEGSTFTVILPKEK